MASEDGRIYIEDLSERLNRSGLPRAVHTIRRWIADDVLPVELRPDREGGRNRLFWRQDQLEGVCDFAREREKRRGWQHD
jgi:hypothetical protein